MKDNRILHALVERHTNQRSTQALYMYNLFHMVPLQEIGVGVDTDLCSVAGVLHKTIKVKYRDVVVMPVHKTIKAIILSRCRDVCAFGLDV